MKAWVVVLGCCQFAGCSPSKYNFLLPIEYGDGMGLSDTSVADSITGTDNATDTAFSGDSVVGSDTFVPSDTNPPSPWPNLPTALTFNTEWAFSGLPPACCPSNSWFFSAQNGQFLSDATALESPPGIVQQNLSPNQIGQETKIGYTFTNAGVPEIYTAFYFKISSPFIGLPSGTTGLLRLTTFAGSSALGFDLFGVTTNNKRLGVAIVDVGNYDNSHLITGGTGPGTVNVPGNQATTVVSEGVWHLAEWRFRRSTNATSQDGELEWWLDGERIGYYTTVNFSETIFSVNMYFNWDNPATFLTQDIFIQFDHMLIATP